MDKRQRRVLEKRRIKERKNLSFHEKELFRMIKTKRVRLEKFEYFEHYLVPLLFAPFPIVFIWKTITTINFENLNLTYFLDNDLFLYSLVLFLFAFFIKYDRLRLKSIKSQISIQDLHIVIRKIGKELNWTNIHLYDFGEEACVEGSFWKGRFTETVIIIFDEDNGYILVNSHTNCWKKGSGFSLSRNRKNEQKLIQKIKEYEATKKSFKTN